MVFTYVYTIIFSGYGIFRYFHCNLYLFSLLWIIFINLS